MGLLMSDTGIERPYILQLHVTPAVPIRKWPSSTPLFAFRFSPFAFRFSLFNSIHFFHTGHWVEMPRPFKLDRRASKSHLLPHHILVDDLDPS
jgi:hypothetical protein